MAGAVTTGFAAVTIILVKVRDWVEDEDDVEDERCKEPGKGFRGGKKKDRDRDFGIKDKDFWKWWEKVKQRYGDPDATPDNIEDAFRDWIGAGRPRVNK